MNLSLNEYWIPQERKSSLEFKIVIACTAVTFYGMLFGASAATAAGWLQLAKLISDIAGLSALVGLGIIFGFPLRERWRRRKIRLVSSR